MTASPVPGIAMRGAGYYSANTVGAKTVIDKAGDLVAEAIAAMPVESGSGAFAIADFGAADGGTSLDMMRRAVGLVRARAPARPVTLTYTDLPHNDFSALFRLTQGMLGDTTVSPLAAIPGLYIFASGASFYRQLFPEESLDLGFSATAMHWLSRKPGPIADHVHAVASTPAERRVFARQAEDDWSTILLARGRELKRGGRLVFANFCIVGDGRYLGHTEGVDMFDSFTARWRELRDKGRISEAEFRAATFQQYYRAPEDFAAPLRDPHSPVSRSGLRLERIFTAVTPCPFAARFSETRDASDFAKSYVPTLRSWSETVFSGALDASRPDAERRAIVDEFYASYEADVARCPDGHRMDYVHCFMVIVKD
jgi:hypothetical protein